MKLDKREWSLRGCWIIAAFLVALMPTMPTLAATIEIDFGRTQNPSQTGLLLADVTGDVFDMRLVLTGGSAAGAAEREKCKLLAELAESEPISVFLDAVSTAVSLEMTFSESRDGATFGNAWSEALGQFGNVHGVEFDALASGEDAIPITQVLRFDVVLAGDTRFEVSDPLQAYIVSKISAWLNKDAERDIDTFYETGIFRTATRDQSIICGVLAFETVEVTASIDARINDRVTKTPILDKECLGRTVELASAEFLNRYSDNLAALGADNVISLLLGAIVGDVASQGLFADSAMKRSPPCVVSTGQSAITKEALKLWSRIVPLWLEGLRESEDGSLGEATLSQLSAEHQTRSFESTKVSYSYASSLSIQ